MTDYYKASTHVALPVKWMPPEMLHDGISNEKTDVVSLKCKLRCSTVYALI